MELLFEGAGGLKHFILRLANALLSSALRTRVIGESDVFIIFTRARDIEILAINSKGGIFSAPHQSRYTDRQRETHTTSHIHTYVSKWGYTNVAPGQHKTRVSCHGVAELCLASPFRQVC